MKKVFLIPHAGGLSTPYKNLGNSFPGFDFEVLNFKGRGHTYFDFNQLSFNEFIVMAYEDLKSKLNDDFVILGHSFGALIALELLKLYRLEAKTAKALFIASSFTPPTSINLKNRIHLSKLSNLDLLKHVEALAPLQSRVKDSKDSLDSFLHHIRGDFLLLDSYQFQSEVVLPYPILALCGDKDISANYVDQNDWSLFTTNDFELMLYSGKHFDLFVNQDAKNKINSTLNEFFGDKK